MFPDSLSRAAQLHVPFEASLHLSDSNFNSSEQKTEWIPHLSVFNQAQWETGGEEARGGGHNHSPVEMSCSCDQCPSKVRLQRCVFSSDGSQDRQIMRSQPSRLQTLQCLARRFGQCSGPHESFSLLTADLPAAAHFDSPLVRKNNTQSGREIMQRNFCQIDFILIWVHFFFCTYLSSLHILTRSPPRLPVLLETRIWLCLQSPALLRMCADLINPNAVHYRVLINHWLLSANTFCSKGLLMEGKPVLPGREEGRLIWHVNQKLLAPLLAFSPDRDSGLGFPADSSLSASTTKYVYILLYRREMAAFVAEVEVMHYTLHN